MKMTRRNFLSASAFTLLACGLAPAAHAEETNSLLTGLLGSKAETALPPKPLTAKVVDANPFMGFSESNIHHECYESDSSLTISTTPSARSWAVSPSGTWMRKR